MKILLFTFLSLLIAYQSFCQENDEYYETIMGDLQPTGQYPTPGQIGGLSATDKGLWIFHRGDHKWETDTFDENNHYTKAKRGPIHLNTLMKMKRGSMRVVSEWGKDMFYMPHGLTVDHKGRFWVTDVALHQVFMYTLGNKTPVLTLGKAFQPGNDTEHFCKPTDVAVAKDGSFFVADGYCNSRVLKYNKNGKVETVIGNGEYVIPHSLALMEELDQLAIADRENSRIVIVGAGLKNKTNTGKKMKEISDDRMGRVFGLSYNEEDNLLYAVTGYTPGLESMGFTVEMSTAEIIDIWSPLANFNSDSESQEELGAPFKAAHDVAVTKDGNEIYVGEVGPNQVWRFQYANEDKETEE